MRKATSSPVPIPLTPIRRTPVDTPASSMQSVSSTTSSRTGISLSTFLPASKTSPRTRVVVAIPTNASAWVQWIEGAYLGLSLGMEEEDIDHLVDFYKTAKTRKDEKDKILECIKKVFSELVKHISKPLESKENTAVKLVKLIGIIRLMVDSNDSQFEVIDSLIKTTLIKKLIKSITQQEYTLAISLCHFLENIDIRYTRTFMSELFITEIMLEMERGNHEHASALAEFLKIREPRLFESLPEDINSYRLAEAEVLSGQSADLSFVTNFNIFEGFMRLLLSLGMNLVEKLKTNEVKSICLLITKNKADPAPIYEEIKSQLEKSLDEDNYEKARVFADMLSSNEAFYDYPRLVKRLIKIEEILGSGALPNHHTLSLLQEPSLVREIFIRKQSRMVSEYLIKGDISNALGRVRLLMQVLDEKSFTQSSVLLALMKEVLTIIEDDKSDVSSDFIGFSVNLGKILAFSNPLFVEYKQKIYYKLVACFLDACMQSHEPARIKEISSILSGLKALPDIQTIEKDIEQRFGRISLSRPASRTYGVS
jgi:hypothetical protein